MRGKPIEVLNESFHLSVTRRTITTGESRASLSIRWLVGAALPGSAAAATDQKRSGSGIRLRGCRRYRTKIGEEVSETEVQVAPVPASAERIGIWKHGQEVAHLTQYYVQSDSHANPSAFCEDWWVDPESRGAGLGRRLVDAAVEAARRHGCYKVVANSRFNRPSLHAYIEEIGFVRHGYEFRIDLNDEGLAT